MKKIIIAYILFINSLVFSQVSKTIFTNSDVSITYSYEKIGTIKDPESGSDYTEYKFSLLVKNTSGKFYDVKAQVSYDHVKVASQLLKKKDANFVWNNSFSSTINLNYANQKCSDFPKDDTNKHVFVLCPNEEVLVEKKFIYPVIFGNDPPITWNSISANEVFKALENTQKITIIAPPKKTNAKPEIIKAKINKSYFIGMDLEDATLKLDGLFTKNGYVFENLTDDEQFLFNKQLVKTDTINTTIRHFTLQNNINIDLFADINKVLRRIQFRMPSGGNKIKKDALNKKIITLLGIVDWQLIEIFEGQKVVGANGNLATIYSNEELIIDIWKKQNFESVSKSVLELNSLSYLSTYEDFILFYVNELKKLNLKVLFARPENLIIDDKTKDFNISIQEIKFTNGVTLSFMQDEFRKKSVTISCTNPIFFNSLKKSISKDWKLAYNFSLFNELSYYYKNNNNMMKITPGQKYINIVLMPEKTNKTVKMQYGDYLSLTEINEIYHNFDNSSALNDYLADYFYLKAGTSQCSIQDSKYITDVYFHNDKAAVDGLLYAITTANKEDIDEYKRQTDELENVIAVDFCSDGSNCWTYFYNKSIYQSYQISQNKQKELKAIADEQQRQRNEQQRREAEETRRNNQIRASQEEAERQRRAQNTVNTINTMTDMLINSLKKN